MSGDAIVRVGRAPSFRSNEYVRLEDDQLGVN